MSLGPVKDIRRMQVERIRAKLMDDNQLSRDSSRRWADSDVRILLSELDDAERRETRSSDRYVGPVEVEEVRDFAGEFLQMSLGSLEWESLRSLARDILKRTGGSR